MTHPDPPTPSLKDKFTASITMMGSGSLTVLILTLLSLGSIALFKPHWVTLLAPSQFSPRLVIPPLVMKGGDPYLRALMRTISASESNTAQPYHVIYGGQHVQDLSQHPDLCVTIKGGPNRGNCSTASGRYQFLNTTWAEKARQYHPQPHTFLLWKHYSFEPQYQDQVLYRWLSDSQAWGTDLSQLLKKGAIDEVLKRLSPTWTSLGYGIENNLITHRLPTLYEQLLQEELRSVAPTVSTAKTKTAINRPSAHP